jgi:hypothetical protein
MSTLAVNTITNAAGGNTATINGMTPTADSLQGFRNRIINGDMRIDQRNNGASVNITASGAYTVDRFQVSAATTTFTVQRSTTAPAGFVNSLQVTNGTGTPPSAGQFNGFIQPIEGNNVADLGWGTSNAQSITLSFWVRASVTGTYAGRLAAASDARTYVFTYTINATNTWEYKTITVPGDTTGTWLTNNSVGIQVLWDLGSGSNFNGTAGVWGTSNFTRTSGSVNWTSNSSATFNITGVQLEAGTVATPFERRDYGRELIMCQRYYTTLNSGGRQMYRNHGFDSATVRDIKTFTLPVVMRATPTLVVSGSTVDIDNGTAVSGGTVSGTAFSERVVVSYTSYTSQPAGGVIHNASFSATVSAEL